MRRALLLITAVAGLDGSALAGADRGVRFDFSADRTGAFVGDVVTWTVSASITGYPDATAYFGGFDGSFVAAFADTGEILSTESLMGNSATTPTFDGATINDVNIFNAAVLGTNDPSNPIAIFRFEMLVTTIPPVGRNATTGYGLVGEASVFPNDGIFAQRDVFTNYEVRTDGVVPTPGAGIIILAGVCSFAGCRRRT